MASQVLSGANNASYTNNTGQNVRLIINYMSNVTSMTWAGVSITAESTTIGKDIQNITGEFRKIKAGNRIRNANNPVNPGSNLFGSYELDTEILDGVVANDASVNNSLAGGNEGYSIRPLTTTEKNSGNVERFGTAIQQQLFEAGTREQNVFYIPKTISRGGDFPTELMLANGESFSSVCGAFNAIVIKEDGT